MCDQYIVVSLGLGQTGGHTLTNSDKVRVSGRRINNLAGSDKSSAVLIDSREVQELTICRIGRKVRERLTHLARVCRHDGDRRGSEYWKVL